MGLKHLFLLTFLFIIQHECFSQKKKLSKIPAHQTVVSDQCIYQNKFTTDQRRKIYPFNIIDSIALISFKHDDSYYARNFTKVNYDLIIRDSIFEYQRLDSGNIDTLTDILFNNMLAPIPKEYSRVGTVSQCFIPHNAILFYKDGIPIENILICFKCENYRLSAKLKFKDDCSGKTELLKHFFEKNKINFGVKNDIREETD